MDDKEISLELYMIFNRIAAIAEGLRPEHTDSLLALHRAAVLISDQITNFRALADPHYCGEIHAICLKQMPIFAAKLRGKE